MRCTSPSSPRNCHGISSYLCTWHPTSMAYPAPCNSSSYSPSSSWMCSPPCSIADWGRRLFDAAPQRALGVTGVTGVTAPRHGCLVPEESPKVRCTSSPNTRPTHAVPLLHRYPPRWPPRTARRGSALDRAHTCWLWAHASLPSALCATTKLPWPPLLQLPTAASLVACSRRIQPRSRRLSRLSRLSSHSCPQMRDGASPTATTRPRVAHRHPHPRFRRRSAGSSLASADRLPSDRVLGV